MRFADLVRLTTGSVRAHRLRAALTALGIGIGVTAVVLLTSIGEGVHRFVVSEFTQFGTNIVSVTPGRTQTMGGSIGSLGNVRPLTVDDAEALRRAPYVETTNALVQGNAEVEALGLAEHLDHGDFQLAGGCWNARFNRGGDPGFSLSRHSWGTAIDFNPSTNRYGDEPTISPEVVEVFRRWGFSWGGTWTVPDGMHFEWVRLPSEYSVACSSLIMSEESQETAEAGWSIEPRVAGCP